MASTSELPDYYAILGVSPDASLEEITRAYRALARECHPDKLPPTATPAQRAAANDRFKAVSGAVMVLRDPTTRAQYDAARRFGSSSGFASSGFQQPNMDVSSALSVWLQVVAGAITRRSTASPTMRTVQLLSSIGIPAVLAFAGGGTGAKLGMNLMNTLNGGLIEAELSEMAPAERTAYQDAAEMLQRYFDTRR